MEATKETTLCSEFEILDLFQRHNLLLIGPSDVNRLLNISKGTASRKLQALAEAGYLEQVAIAQGNKYKLGARMGFCYISYLRQLHTDIEQAQQLINVALDPLKDIVLKLAGEGSKHEPSEN